MPTKILAIDDSKTMRLGIKITFAAEDAEVVAVSKGSEAVARARQMGADVVLVDHKLAAGEPSGIEVCRLLRSDPSTKNTPIIFLVPARGGVSDADAKQAGANLVLAKPFETQELIDKVAEVVSAGSASVSKVAAKQAVGGRQSVGTGTTGRGPAPAPSPAPSSPAPAMAAPNRQAPTSSSQIPLRADAGGRPLLSSPTSRPSPVKPKPAEPVGFSPISGGLQSNASSQKSRGTAVVNGGASTGKIPIAIPIPFASASAPSKSMLRRLEEAQGNGGAALDGIDPKVAEALLQLSSDVIERVVWEVVPEMAEIIIREKAQSQG